MVVVVVGVLFYFLVLSSSPASSSGVRISPLSPPACDSWWMAVAGGGSGGGSANKLEFVLNRITDRLVLVASSPICNHQGVGAVGELASLPGFRFGLEGSLQGGGRSAPLLLFDFLRGEGGSREVGRAASYFQQVRYSIPTVLCSPSHLRAERRPSESYLPAGVHEGRQSSSGSTSVSSSFAWCRRRRCGDGLAPSGSVPGGDVVGFVLRLKFGLDCVLQFSFGVLFAMSRDQLVISLLSSSLDVTYLV